MSTEKATVYGQLASQMSVTAHDLLMDDRISLHAVPLLCTGRIALDADRVQSAQGVDAATDPLKARVATVKKAKMQADDSAWLQTRRGMMQQRQKFQQDDGASAQFMTWLTMVDSLMSSDASLASLLQSMKLNFGWTDLSHAPRFSDPTSRSTSTAAGLSPPPSEPIDGLVRSLLDREDDCTKGSVLEMFSSYLSSCVANKGSDVAAPALDLQLKIALHRATSLKGLLEFLAQNDVFGASVGNVMLSVVETLRVESATAMAQLWMSTSGSLQWRHLWAPVPFSVRQQQAAAKKAAAGEASASKAELCRYLIDEATQEIILVTKTHIARRPLNPSTSSLGQATGGHDGTGPSVSSRGEVEERGAADLITPDESFAWSHVAPQHMDTMAGVALGHCALALMSFSASPAPSSLLMYHVTSQFSISYSVQVPDPNTGMVTWRHGLLHTASVKPCCPYSTGGSPLPQGTNCRTIASCLTHDKTAIDCVVVMDTTLEQQRFMAWLVRVPFPLEDSVRPIASDSSSSFVPSRLFSTMPGDLVGKSVQLRRPYRQHRRAPLLFTKSSGGLTIGASFRPHRASSLALQLLQRSAGLSVPFVSVSGQETTTPAEVGSDAPNVSDPSATGFTMEFWAWTPPTFHLPCVEWRSAVSIGNRDKLEFCIEMQQESPAMTTWRCGWRAPKFGSRWTHVWVPFMKPQVGPAVAEANGTQGQWSHVKLFCASGVITLAVDGITSAPLSFPLVAASIPVGKSVTWVLGKRFVGCIAFLRLWSHNLAPSGASRAADALLEGLTKYQPVLGNEPRLLVCLDIVDGGGDLVADRGPLGLHCRVPDDGTGQWWDDDASTDCSLALLPVPEPQPVSLRPIWDVLPPTFDAMHTMASLSAVPSNGGGGDRSTEALFLVCSKWLHVIEFDASFTADDSKGRTVGWIGLDRAIDGKAIQSDSQVASPFVALSHVTTGVVDGALWVVATPIQLPASGSENRYAAQGHAPVLGHVPLALCYEWQHVVNDASATKSTSVVRVAPGPCRNVIVSLIKDLGSYARDVLVRRKAPMGALEIFACATMDDLRGLLSLIWDATTAHAAASSQPQDSAAVEESDFAPTPSELIPSLLYCAALVGRVVCHRGELRFAPLPPSAVGMLSPSAPPPPAGTFQSGGFAANSSTSCHPTGVPIDAIDIIDAFENPSSKGARVMSVETFSNADLRVMLLGVIAVHYRAVDANDTTTLADPAGCLLKETLPSLVPSSQCIAVMGKRTRRGAVATPLVVEIFAGLHRRLTHVAHARDYVTSVGTRDARTLCIMLLQECQKTVATKLKQVQDGVSILSIDDEQPPLWVALASMQDALLAAALPSAENGSNGDGQTAAGSPTTAPNDAVALVHSVCRAASSSLTMAYQVLRGCRNEQKAMVGAILNASYLHGVLFNGLTVLGFMASPLPQPLVDAINELRKPATAVLDMLLLLVSPNQAGTAGNTASPSEDPLTTQWISALVRTLRFLSVRVACSFIRSLAVTAAPSAGGRVKIISTGQKSLSPSSVDTALESKLFCRGMLRVGSSRDALVRLLLQGLGPLGKALNDWQAQNVSIAFDLRSALIPVERTFFAGLCNIVLTQSEWMQPNMASGPLRLITDQLKILRRWMLFLRQSDPAGLKEARNRALLLCKCEPYVVAQTAAVSVGGSRGGGGSSLSKKNALLEGGSSGSSSKPAGGGSSNSTKEWKQVFASWKRMKRLRELQSLMATGHHNATAKDDGPILTLAVQFIQSSNLVASEIDLFATQRLQYATRRLGGLQAIKDVVTEGEDLPALVPMISRCFTHWHPLEGVLGCAPEVVGRVRGSHGMLLSEATMKCLAFLDARQRASNRAAVGTLAAFAPWVRIFIALVSTRWTPSDFRDWNLDVVASVLLRFARSGNPKGASAHSVNGLDPRVEQSGITIVPNSTEIAFKGTALRWISRGTCVGNEPWTTTGANVPKYYYYEVHILELAPGGAAAVGVGPATYNLARPPGWEPGSCALHGDDGAMFQESSTGRQVDAGFGAGDVIGCGLVTGTGDVFWTKNGVLIPAARCCGFRPATPLYPMVGLDTRGALTFNFGAQTFLFDLSTIDNRHGPRPRALHLQARDALLNFCARLSFAVQSHQDSALATFSSSSSTTGKDPPEGLPPSSPSSAGAANLFAMPLKLIDVYVATLRYVIQEVHEFIGDSARHDYCAMLLLLLRSMVAPVRSCLSDGMPLPPNTALFTTASQNTCMTAVVEGLLKIVVSASISVQIYPTTGGRFLPGSLPPSVAMAAWRALAEVCRLLPIDTVDAAFNRVAPFKKITSPLGTSLQIQTPTKSSAPSVAFVTPDSFVSFAIQEAALNFPFRWPALMATTTAAEKERSGRPLSSVSGDAPLRLLQRFVDGPFGAPAWKKSVVAALRLMLGGGRGVGDKIISNIYDEVAALCILGGAPQGLVPGDLVTMVPAANASGLSKASDAQYVLVDIVVDRGFAIVRSCPSIPSRGSNGNARNTSNSGGGEKDAAESNGAATGDLDAVRTFVVSINQLESVVSENAHGFLAPPVPFDLYPDIVRLMKHRLTGFASRSMSHSFAASFYCLNLFRVLSGMTSTVGKDGPTEAPLSEKDLALKAGALEVLATSLSTMLSICSTTVRKADFDFPRAGEHLWMLTMQVRQFCPLSKRPMLDTASLQGNHSAHHGSDRTGHAMLFPPTLPRSVTPGADECLTPEGRLRMAQQLAMRGFSLDMCTVALEEASYSRSGALRLLTQQRDDMLMFFEQQQEMVEEAEEEEEGEEDEEGQEEGGEHDDDDEENDEESEEEGLEDDDDDDERHRDEDDDGSEYDVSGSTEPDDTTPGGHHHLPHGGEEDEHRHHSRRYRRRRSSASQAVSTPSSSPSSSSTSTSIAKITMEGGVAFDHGYISLSFTQVPQGQESSSIQRARPTDDICVEWWMRSVFVDAHQVLWCAHLGNGFVSVEIHRGSIGLSIVAGPAFAHVSGGDPLMAASIPLLHQDVGTWVRVSCGICTTHRKVSLCVRGAAVELPIPPEVLLEDEASSGGVPLHSPWTIGAGKDGTAGFSGALCGFRAWFGPWNNGAAPARRQSAGALEPITVPLIQLPMDEGRLPLVNRVTNGGGFTVAAEVIGALVWLTKGTSAPDKPSPADRGDDSAPPASANQPVHRGSVAPEVDFSTLLDPIRTYALGAGGQPSAFHDRTAVWRGLIRYSADEAIAAFADVARQLARHYLLCLVGDLLLTAPISALGSTTDTPLVTPKSLATFIVDCSAEVAFPHTPDALVREALPKLATVTASGGVKDPNNNDNDDVRPVQSMSLPVLTDFASLIFEEVMHRVLLTPTDPVILESVHPCKPTHEPPKEVSVVGQRVYDIHFDRHMVQANHVVVTLFLDSALTQPVHRSMSGTEMPSVRIVAPRFYFDVRLEGSASLWGYRMTVLVGVDRLLGAVDVIETILQMAQKYNIISTATNQDDGDDGAAVGPQGRPTKNCNTPLHWKRSLDTLIACIYHNVGIVRRRLITTATMFTRSCLTLVPENRRLMSQVPKLLELQRSFEKRYSREMNMMTCSEYVQILSEFFIAQNELEWRWAAATKAKERRGEVAELSAAELATKFSAYRSALKQLYMERFVDTASAMESPNALTSERTALEKCRLAESIKVELTTERMWTVSSEFNGSVVCASVGSREGKWYFEITLLAATELAVGIVTPAFDREHGMLGVSSGSWCQILNQRSGQRSPLKPRDVIGVAMDIDNRIITFTLNGSPMGSPLTFADFNSSLPTPALGPLAGSSFTSMSALEMPRPMDRNGSNDGLNAIRQTFGPDDWSDSDSSYHASSSNAAAIRRRLRERVAAAMLTATNGGGTVPTATSMLAGGGMMTVSNASGAVAVAGSAMDAGTDAAGAASTEVFFPAIMLRHDSAVMVNFGSAHFDSECPKGYLPVDPAALTLGSLVPLKPVRGFVDVFHALSGALPNAAAQPLPPFVHRDANPFEMLGNARRGPPVVGLSALAPSAAVVTLLEVRNAERHFSTAVADCSVHSGRWYFEVTLQSQGAMQIGWISAASADNPGTIDGNRPRNLAFQCRPAAGKGVGDDDTSMSIALDLSRKCFWFAGVAHPLVLSRRWANGDIVGCGVDFSLGGHFLFSINGNVATDISAKELGMNLSEGLIPAVSLRSGNVVQFNFGSSPLRFKPEGWQSLAVPDTWRERIDAFYGQFGSSIQSMTWNAAADVTAMLKIIEQSPSAVLVKIVDALCKAHSRTVHQLDVKQNLGEGPFGAALWAPLKDRTSDEVDEMLRILKLFDRLVLTVAPLMNLQLQNSVNLYEGHMHPGASYLALESGLSGIFLRARPLMFQSTRHGIAAKAVRESVSRSVETRLTLHRAVAAARNAAPAQDPTGLKSVFGQTFSVCTELAPRIFRTTQRFWTVVFGGEGAEDVGGPFRDHMTSMCAELMSPSLDLFIQSPNQAHNVGEMRDRWIPKPSSRSPLQLQMYQFLGAMMGGALRIAEPLSLYLPPLVWKALSFHPVSAADLDGYDCLCRQFVEEFAQVDENAPGAEEAFSELFSTQMFTTQLSDGSEKELVPNGSNVPVTVARAKEYAARVLDARLREFEPQLLALRAGLCSVIPAIALAMFTPDELELRVCGQPDFTVAELKESTTFEGLSPFDRRVTFLWQVIEDMTPAERRLFLRFVSGRERLPVRLRVLPMASCSGDQDAALPRAATCFFALELPDYSTVEIMKARILFAVTTCFEIDTDYRAREVGDNETPVVVVGTETRAMQQVPLPGVGGTTTTAPNVMGGLNPGGGGLFDIDALLFGENTAPSGPRSSPPPGGDLQNRNGVPVEETD